MTQLIVAAAVCLATVALAAVLRRRRVVAPPTQPRAVVPAQLDRADFAGTTPWLLVLFSSATCAACADVRRKADVLASAQVAVVDAEFGTHRSLHDKYGITAVPVVVLADGGGVVRASFVGPMTATDLWAAVAEARQPGSTPSGIVGHCQRDATV